MKLIVTAFLVLSQSVFAQTMSRVQADIVCEQAGGGVAVKFPTATKPAKAWQTDPGEKVGLELKVTSFTGKSKSDFSFDALLMDVTVKGSVKNSVLTYKGLDNETGKWITILKAKCI